MIYKYWKSDAVLRLLTSVIVCAFSGSVLACIWQYTASGAKDQAVAFFSLAGGALLCFGTALALANVAWHIETVMKRMAALLAFFYVGMFAGAWAQKIAGSGAGSVAQMVIAALSFQGAALVLATRFLRDHQTNWSDAFGFGNAWLRAVLAGLAAALLFLPVGWGLQQLSAALINQFSHFGIHPEEQQAVRTLRAATGGWDRATLGLITIGLAPLAEESLFRGILYAWIKSLGYPRLALWGSSLLFALVHMNVVTFIPLLVLALLLVWIYERTDNLLAPMATHSLFNGLNFAMLYWLDKRPA